MAWRALHLRPALQLRCAARAACRHAHCPPCASHVQQQAVRMSTDATSDAAVLRDHWVVCSRTAQQQGIPWSCTSMAYKLGQQACRITESVGLSARARCMHTWCLARAPGHPICLPFCCSGAGSVKRDTSALQQRSRRRFRRVIRLDCCCRLLLLLLCGAAAATREAGTCRTRPQHA